MLGFPVRPPAFVALVAVVAVVALPLKAPLKVAAVIVPVPASILLLFVFILLTEILGFPVRPCVMYFHSNNI